MAKLDQLTRHIESYVDSSATPAQQVASMDAIGNLVKDNALTVEALVRELGMYLTTTDDIIRARGIHLLAEVLTRIESKPLDIATVHSLIAFFKDRLADWRALRGALVGCLALIRRKSNVGVVTDSDAKAVAQSFLENLQVQSLGQHDRKLCFELLNVLLELYSDAVSSLGEDLVYGICGVVDAEKDPEYIFEILESYFPIHFTHPGGGHINVQREELSRALMSAFSSMPFLEPFVIPLLIEKLSSSLLSAKVDSLKYLKACSSKYGAERMANHARAIWSSLKDAISTYLEEPVFSFTSEPIVGVNFQKNEIVTEALSLLQLLVKQNSGFADNHLDPDIYIGVKGMTGVMHMLRVLQELEGAVFANLSMIFVHGNLRSSETVVQLLECFSDKLLPWIHENGCSEEPVVHFAVEIWSQIGICMGFSVPFEEKGLLGAIMKVMKLAVGYCSVESQNIIIKKAYDILLSHTSFQFKELEGSPLVPGQYDVSNRDKWVLSIFASAVIAVSPQTCIPNERIVLHLFIITILRGVVPVAQALGSVINKMISKSEVTETSCDLTLEEAVDISGLPLIQDSQEETCMKNLDPLVMKCAADAFHILMSDSEDCLNRKFHARIRPLYKQRFFSSMMPIFLQLIPKSHSPTSRSALYRAFAHIISDTPLIVVLSEAKKLIPILLDCLSMLTEDIQDKDMLYGLLLVLSGILTERNGHEAVAENIRIIVNGMIRLVEYPHKSLVRETAIQCLVAMSEMPHARIYPMRSQVLKAISRALDDKKRDVRLEAVKCRQAWASTAARSLHF
ncbi:hypothetical protein K1719_021096 [Acacia pycnantha]|nr:hypothetical protein K1719_021096 [Acacia pycnantha]